MDTKDGTDLYFRVLGPLTVEWRGEPLDLGGPQRCLVLAVLLARANEVVSVDSLIDALWGDSPPASYRVQLQGLVSDLRRRLAHGGDREAAPIVTRAPGYVLRIPTSGLDVARAEAEIGGARQARAAGDSAAAVRLLDVALDRWRGPAFAGLSSPLVDGRARVIDELRLSAIEDRVDARLADGRALGLSAELISLVADHPLHEPFHRQLMTVYARTGRTAEALAVYRDLHRRSVAELGLAPSAGLQLLHRQILVAQDASSTAPPDPEPAATGQVSASAYRQLPPDLPDFTGRRAELTAIEEVGTRPDRAAVAIVAIEGMGGIGKTRLAVHAAHLLVERGGYQDVQLFVDLRGVSEDGERAEPSTVLESFLRLLGVPVERIPAHISARSAVFRDRLAGHRALIVLDNAADEDQIEPLLPGADCLVIVTSRRGLVLPGARHLALDVLSEDEAAALLTSVVGEHRVAAEPVAARALTARCGYLPLAVDLAAQRLRARPAWPIAHLVEQLIDHDRTLDALAVANRTVESTFALSYRALHPDERRLLRLVGIHPGSDVSAASVAALVEVELADAARVLESLLDQHLLQQATPQRYHLHDLLRAYAVRLCRREDGPGEGPAALSRLLDWYLHAATAATATIRRFSVPYTLEVPPAKSALPEFVDRDRALAWLDAEYANILAANRVAAAGMWSAHAAQLAHILQPYFVLRGRVDDWIDALRWAMQAAEKLGDARALAHTMTDLGNAHSAAGRVVEARAHLERALVLHERHDDRYGQALTLNHLATTSRRLGLHIEAAERYASALDLFRGLHERIREASTQSNLSVELHLLGRNDEALLHAHQALEIQLSTGLPGEAALRINLGLMYARLDRHDEAVEQAIRALALRSAEGSGPGRAQALANLCFSYARLGRRAEAIDSGLQAIGIARCLGMPEIEADAHNTLAEAYRSAGDPARAREHHRKALAIASDIDDAEEQARARRGLAHADAGRPSSDVDGGS